MKHLIAPWKHKLSVVFTCHLVLVWETIYNEKIRHCHQLSIYKTYLYYSKFSTNTARLLGSFCMSEILGHFKICICPHKTPNFFVVWVET